MKDNILQNIRKSIRMYGLNSMLIRNAVNIFLLVLVPIVLAFAWIFNYGAGILSDSTNAANLRSLNKAQAMMDMVLSRTQTACEALYMSTEVDLLMNRKQQVYPNYENIELRQSIYNIANTALSGQLTELNLYSSVNGRNLHYRSTGASAPHNDTNWLDAFKESESASNTAFYRLVERAKGQAQLFYFRPLRAVADMEMPSFIAAGHSLASFDSLLADTQGAGRQDILIIDRDGQVLYSTNREWMGYTLNSIWMSAQYGDATGTRQICQTADGSEYMLNVVRSEISSLRFVSVISGNEFNSSVHAFYRTIAAMLCLCLLLAFLCTLYISVQAYKPVTLIREMLNDPMNISTDAMRDNELKHILGVIYRKNGGFAQGGNDIADHVDALNKARVKALQSQINPHFLYNTLQAISLVFEKESGLTDSKSVDLLEELSSLVRDTTEITSSLVPLREELGYINKYLLLLKARFDDSLVYDIDAPEETLGYSVPKMSLQPIVENVFKHGKAFQRGVGTIFIQTRIQEEALYVTVQDNGGGLPREQIDSINESLRSDIVFSDKNIGLMNVNTRLRLLFGNEAGLHLSPIPDGLQVTMKVSLYGGL